MIQESERSSNPAARYRSSPLDRDLATFLRLIDDLPEGYRPVVHPALLAKEGGWMPAFSEALFDSAKGRRLVVPYQPRRNVTRWRISPRGKRWLSDRDDERMQ